MIDRQWCKKQITVKEAEAMSHLDFLGLDSNFTVVDKGTWFNEPLLPKRSDWVAFKAKIEAVDDLWTFSSPMYGQSMHGLAILRNDEVIHEFIVGMR